MLSKILLISLLVFCCISCSDKVTKTNDLIFIQKGKSFDYYLKQKDYDYINEIKNYNNEIKNFEFEFKGQTLRCNMVPVVNKIYQTTSTTNNNTNTGSIVNPSTGQYNNNFNNNQSVSRTQQTSKTSNYYVLTDKNKIVIDFFYIYEVKNGTKKTDIKILESMNKAYLNYLIVNEVYDNEDIKDMDEEEKLIKLILH
jgi:hypothetical protein